MEVQASELTTVFSFAVVKAVKAVVYDNKILLSLNFTFVEFPQQETKRKAEFTIERKMLSS